MSKNELMNAFENFLNALEGSVQTMDQDQIEDLVDEAINRFDFDRPIEAYLEDTDYVLRDDLDDLIEEAVEDYAGREGYATESMVQRAIDDSLDCYDFSYAIDDELDRRGLVERSEVEDIVDDFLDDKGYEATIDTLIQEKDTLLERLVALEMDAVLGKLEAIVG